MTQIIKEMEKELSYGTPGGVISNPEKEKEFRYESYDFAGKEELVTPVLVYYIDTIRENIRKCIDIAGGPERLWPHIKSHKMEKIVRLILSMGISRIKTATVAEAELAASCGAEHVLLAYQMVGVNIGRYIRLVKAFPKTDFYTLVDCDEVAAAFSEQAAAEGLTLNLLVDVNPGLNRTGLPVRELMPFLDRTDGAAGIRIAGVHWYDGQFNDKDPDVRAAKIRRSDEGLAELLRDVREKHPQCAISVLGGSPEFPVHAGSNIPGSFLSPGTVFIDDWQTAAKYPEMPFVPGAALLTRVVSRPEEGYFCLDLGYKGISSDKTTRGILVGRQDCEPYLQNEEHWVWKMKEGHEADCPKIGEEMFVIPSHICPCSQLYPEVPVISEGRIVDWYTVSARNRRITY